jgi:hypothetical protein
LPEESLIVASNLHSHLVKKGYMWSFFDEEFNFNFPSPNDRLKPNELAVFDEKDRYTSYIMGREYEEETTRLKAGKVIICDIDAKATTIPVFTRFLRRRSTPKDCIICTESLYEIDFESDEQWMESCQEFAGDWTSKILTFPSRVTFQCSHDINICRDCLAKHLATKLEDQGRRAFQRLDCPECSRYLEYSEIKLYASAETFQKYFFNTP